MRRLISHDTLRRLYVQSRRIIITELYTGCHMPSKTDKRDIMQYCLMGVPDAGQVAVISAV